MPSHVADIGEREVVLTRGGRETRIPNDAVIVQIGGTAPAELLQSFGWPANSIVDLGDITTARGAEAYLVFWLGLMNALGSARFNINVVQ